MSGLYSTIIRGVIRGFSLFGAMFRVGGGVTGFTHVMCWWVCKISCILRDWRPVLWSDRHTTGQSRRDAHAWLHIQDRSRLWSWSPWMDEWVTSCYQKWIDGFTFCRFTWLPTLAGEIWMDQRQILPTRFKPLVYVDWCFLVMGLCFKWWGFIAFISAESEMLASCTSREQKWNKPNSLKVFSYRSKDFFSKDDESLKTGVFSEMLLLEGQLNHFSQHGFVTLCVCVSVCVTAFWTCV